MTAPTIRMLPIRDPPIVCLFSKRGKMTISIAPKRPTKIPAIFCIFIGSLIRRCERRRVIIGTLVPIMTDALAVVRASPL